MKFTKTLALFLALSVAAQQARSQADDKAAQKKEVERVQANVRENLAAVYKADVETVLKHTHPKAIDMLGGRDNARKALEKSLTQLVANGTKLEELKFPSQPTFLKGTENEFVIVPTKIIVARGAKRVESVNFQFGARTLGGADWGYIEGSRLNQDNVFKLFPDFPKKIELPPTSRKLIE